MGTQNRDLGAEAARLRQSAQSARAHMSLKNAEETRDLGIRHDALKQRQRAAEATAKGQREDAKFAEEAAQHAKQRANELSAEAEAARGAGDHDKAVQLEGERLRLSTDADTHAARASRLTRQAAQHEAEAKSLQEPIDDVSHDISRMSHKLRLAEQEVQKLERKARLLDEAHAKATGDDPVAKLDVDDLVERADAISIDATKIEAIESDGGWVRPEPDEEPAPTPMSLPPDKPSAPKQPVKRPEHEAARDQPEVSKEKEVDLDADDAAAVRGQATAARATMQRDYEDKAMLLTKERDEAAREQWSQEQDAKAAQMQVKREQKVVDESRSAVARLNREADAARAKGDHPSADALRENAQRFASDQRVAEARLESARAEADRGLKASQEAKTHVEDLEKQYAALRTQRDQAEKAVDGLEERARLLEEAQKKLEQAEQTGDEQLRKEADALVERAEHVHVDRAPIQDVAPPVEPASGTPSAADGSNATDGDAGPGETTSEPSPDAASPEDLVGDEDNESLQQVAAASDTDTHTDSGPAAALTQESSAAGPDGFDAAAAEQSAFATTGNAGDQADSAGGITPESDADGGPDLGFSEEQTIATADPPAQDEFVEAVDDSGQLV